MIKKFSLFFLIPLISYSSYSQISFGVKSGMNIATTKNIIAFPKNRVGWYIGGRTIIPVHKKIFLQPELLFSSKGYRYIDLSDGKTVAMRLNYLNMPILLGYRIDSKTKIALGPELGYLVKAINYLNKENFDATRSFPQRFDAGIAIGASYNISEIFGIEIRYNYGFGDLYQIDEVGIRRSKFNGANRVFQTGLYYKPLRYK